MPARLGSGGWVVQLAATPWGPVFGCSWLTVYKPAAAHSRKAHVLEGGEVRRMLCLLTLWMRPPHSGLCVRTAILRPWMCEHASTCRQATLGGVANVQGRAAQRRGEGAGQGVRCGFGPIS
eukprot:161542-Chlamydomonas_euryale.AAC.4